MQIAGAYDPRQRDNQMPGPQIHVDMQVLTLLLVQGDQTPREGVTVRMDEVGHVSPARCLHELLLTFTVLEFAEMSLLLPESALLVNLAGEPADS